MNTSLRRNLGWAGLIGGGILLAVSGCAHSKSADVAPTTETAMATTAPSDSGMADAMAAPMAAPMAGPSTQQTPGQPGDGQLTFDSDDAAEAAIVDAARNDDHDQMHKILGPAWKDLLSGDKVADTNAFKEFAGHAAEHSQLEKKDPNTSILDVGADNWPFPIPIVKGSDGKWFFDTAAGETEILARRIGANELNAIDVCHAYVRAQREYFHKDHDGSGLLQYAQHIHSSPGTQDGLYWEADNGQPTSPFGPLMGQAEDEGYTALKEKHSGTPYHGYFFRILKSQGADAPGGAYSYVINGHMVAGFAMIAFPDSYRSSGIMTFIVNQNGKVYQKDLGADTTNLAWKITDYDPDSSWSEVAE